MRRVTDPNDPAMPSVRRIYESQFPETERKPTVWLDAAVQRTEYTLLIAENLGTTLGFAIIFTPSNPDDAALLEYLAIDPAWQGRGIGTMLVRAAINSRPLLTEIESNDEPQSKRRREFYRRLGFRTLIGLSYLLPLPNAPAIELMLINGPKELAPENLRRWLSTIYESVYDCSPDDPRLAIMLQSKIEVD